MSADKESQRTAEFERLSQELDSAEAQSRRDRGIRNRLRKASLHHQHLLARSWEAVVRHHDVIR